MKTVKVRVSKHSKSYNSLQINSSDSAYKCDPTQNGWKVCHEFSSSEIIRLGISVSLLATCKLFKVKTNSLCAILFYHTLRKKKITMC